MDGRTWHELTNEGTRQPHADSALHTDAPNLLLFVCLLQVGFASIVTFLLGKGADKGASNKARQTPADVALNGQIAALFE